MPCNSNTCPNYTPVGDGTGEVCSTPCGVTVERKLSPKWDTKRINVPTWNRDRIMYFYDDVCERAAVHTADGTTPPIPPGGTGEQVQYGLSGVENPNAGRIRKVLAVGYWWQDNTLLCPPAVYKGYIPTAGAASPTRYWDHYPSEQSFEPIRSDTWFSYLYDTAKGVTGKPCYVYCYYTYTLYNGSGDGSRYQTYYGIRKVPYTCNCDPAESYIDYSLEDGKITPEGETDPYPLIWTVGTKSKRIAFKYNGGSTRTGVPTTFHMSEPTQVSASSGTNLTDMDFYEVWNANRISSYMSSQGSFWESEDTKVIQDFSLPNDTIIRCEISSYYDDGDEKYYTRWKVLSVIRYGYGYNSGDGSQYSNQNVYYLYYPSASHPDRVGVALMVSGTADEDRSTGVKNLAIGDTINGWTITDLKHSDDNFNLHVAYITDGTSDFTKDADYTSSSGFQVKVKAGWGIKDRAAVIGKYEFQRKEIVYVTANANLDVPQEDLDVVKPSLQAVVKNGKVTAVKILKPGKNLKNYLIEPILIGIQEPPGYLNRDLYLQLITAGEEPSVAREKAQGSSKKAFCEPIFTGNTLTGVKIIDGGSGYSSSKPPKVAVPYIARKFVTVDVPASSAREKEPGAMEMFKSSEAFKKLSNTPYTYTQYEWDESNPTNVQTPTTDAFGQFTGKNKFDITKSKSKTIQKSGYTVEDYINQQKPTYAEKTTIQLKGSVKSIEKKPDSQIYVRPKSGFSKESAQAFLPPANKSHVSTKNNDYKSLLSAIDKQSQTNASYLRSFGNTQRNLINTGKVDPNIQAKVNLGLTSDQRADLSTSPTIVSKNSTTDPIKPTDINSTNYLNAAENVTISISNLDDGQYYGKEFRNFYRENGFVYGNSAKTFEATLNNIDRIYEDNINSMWEMDLDENRTIVYDGAATKVAKYGFFNLPCATREKKYLVQSYCPDPRKNTFMEINVGVRVAGKNTDNDRGPCSQCLYDNSAVLSAYNSLVNQYGAGNVDIADAYCQGFVFTSYYNGQSDGVERGIPFVTYTLPYSNTLFGGYSRAYVKTQFASQYVYEGCRDYAFSGNLEILHDRTLETQTFVQAINRYGNPYDFMCSRSYEDVISIDEPTINNLVSASTQYDSNAVAQLSSPTLYPE